MEKLKFITNVAGVSFRQRDVKQCEIGDKVKLVREPHNGYDKNAIAIFVGGRKIGFIPKEKNSELASFMDAGGAVEARLLELVGGTEDFPTTGLVIEYAVMLEG